MVVILSIQGPLYRRFHPARRTLTGLFHASADTKAFREEEAGCSRVTLTSNAIQKHQQFVITGQNEIVNKKGHKGVARERIRTWPPKVDRWNMK